MPAVRIESTGVTRGFMRGLRENATGIYILRSGYAQPCRECVEQFARNGRIAVGNQ